MPLSSFPSYEEALKLLYTCHCSQAIIEHVKTVSVYGVEVAESTPGANVELVRIGALLHDIGRCRTHKLNHGIVGAQILRRNHFDERLARIAERHVGAGITANEASRLGLPPGIYLPLTIEEKIVAAVDNLVEGSKRISINKALAEFQRELKDSSIVDRIRDLDKEVFSGRCRART